MFWRLTIYLKFTPKWNNICAEKVLSFILNFDIFCIRVIFGKRELLVPVDLLLYPGIHAYCRLGC